MVTQGRLDRAVAARGRAVSLHTRIPREPLDAARLDFRRWIDKEQRAAVEKETHENGDQQRGCRVSVASMLPSTVRDAHAWRGSILPANAAWSDPNDSANPR